MAVYVITTTDLIRNMSFVIDNGIIVKATPILHWAAQSFVGHSENMLIDWLNTNSIEYNRVSI